MPHLRRFGDYEILGELARGGMGVVYRARQVSLNRPVALKVLLGGALAGPDGRQRLQAEAATAARLQHPGIVPVFDAGVVDGQPFFSMALIEGPTLAEVIRRGPLVPEMAVPCLRRVAEAIEYAHSRGVLHRDLKPSNVLMDSAGEPHVTDFGLAKGLAVGGTLDGGGLTLPGQVLGSPAYMAPEQAAGRDRDRSPATDVYSLGAILYEALTGRPPFLGDTPQAVLDQVRALEPIPLRRLQPSVPADLETICLKCLEKEPGRRYGSARELIGDLDRFARGEPVQARPVGRAGRLARWVRRHRALSAALILGVLLVVGGSIGLGFATWRIQRAERAAVGALREALVEQARARRLAGGLGARSAALESLRQAVGLGLFGAALQHAHTEAVATLALPATRFEPAPRTGPASGPDIPYGRAVVDPTFTWQAHVAADQTVRVHRLDTGELAGDWPPSGRGPLHGQPEFSGNGHHLAVLFRDRLDVFCVTNGRRCFTSDGFTNVHAFSRDGRTFALAGADQTVRVLELPSGRVLHQLSRGLARPSTPTADASRMSLSSNGRRLAVIQARTNCVEVFDLPTGQVLFQTARGRTAKNLAWSDDDRHLGISCQDGTVLVIPTDASGVETELRGENVAMRSIAFHPDGMLVAAASAQRRVTVWDRLTGRVALEASVDAGDLVFSTDGLKLGPVWMGGRLGWLELSPSSCHREVPVGSAQTPFWRLSYDPTGGTLAICSQRELTLLESGSLALLGRATNRLYHHATFDRGGSLWTVDSAGVHRWQAETIREAALRWEPVATPWPGDDWRWIDFSTDGQWLAVANRQKGHFLIRPAGAGVVTAQAAPVGTGEADGQAIAQPGVRLVALDHTARHVVTSSSDRQLRVWDRARARAVAVVPAGGTEGWAGFSPDGRWLATLGEAGLIWSVGHWDAPAATLFPAGETGLGSGAFSHDSRLLAIAANLREIHVFVLQPARRAAVLQGPAPRVIQALGFSPDGRWLSALGMDGTLQRWDLRETDRGLDRLGLPPLFRTGP